MTKLQVIGNCYSDHLEYAQELFAAIEKSGYTLGYNSAQSAVIMKEVDDTPEEE